LDVAKMDVISAPMPQAAPVTGADLPASGSGVAVFICFPW
jgi:hypothetical protein